MHRIGGIEKSQPSGGISYEAANHQAMTDQRRERIARDRGRRRSSLDADPDAELLVLGWGSSYGTLRAAVRRLRDGGWPIAHAHFHTSTRCRRTPPRCSARSSACSWPR